jgi:hypothetical protein
VLTHHPGMTKDLLTEIKAGPIIGHGAT